MQRCVYRVKGNLARAIEPEPKKFGPGLIIVLGRFFCDGRYIFLFTRVINATQTVTPFFVRDIMKVFVTGGSGFVGSHAIKRMVKDGFDVLALARSKTAAQKVLEAGATPIHGDLETIPNWQSALQGCDAVIHCAATIVFWGPWQDFERDIVASTRALHSAAAHAGVKRFIHVSSESVLQDEADLIDIDETYPYPESPNSYYGLAKKLTEQELLHQQTPMQLAILRPTFVWGPGANALQEIGDRANDGSFVWASRGDHSFEAVHVENLAHAIVLATKSQQDKSLYFVTDDESSTFRAFFEQYFTALRVPFPQKSIPNVLIKWIATCTEYIWRFLRIQRKPPLNRFEWAFIGMARRYDIAKIKREIGYKPVISRHQGFQSIAAHINR